MPGEASVDFCAAPCQQCETLVLFKSFRLTFTSLLSLPRVLKSVESLQDYREMMTVTGLALPGMK